MEADGSDEGEADPRRQKRQPEEAASQLKHPKSRLPNDAKKAARGQGMTEQATQEGERGRWKPQREAVPRTLLSRCHAKP